jgi:hypothetical protein
MLAKREADKLQIGYEKVDVALDSYALSLASPYASHVQAIKHCFLVDLFL